MLGQDTERRPAFIDVRGMSTPGYAQDQRDGRIGATPRIDER
jgi:hypothetical protein